MPSIIWWLFLSFCIYILQQAGSRNQYPQLTPKTKHNKNPFKTYNIPSNHNPSIYLLTHTYTQFIISQTLHNSCLEYPPFLNQQSIFSVYFTYLIKYIHIKTYTYTYHTRLKWLNFEKLKCVLVFCLQC